MHLMHILLIWAFSPPHEGARLVMGKQISRYVVRFPDTSFTFPDYRNNGYAQKVMHDRGDGLIEVRVKNSQLASKMKGCRVPPLPGKLEELAQELNAAADGRLADQVSLLVQWFHREIEYEWAYSEDQAVDSVIARMRGNCVGVANLMLFVLEKMGVEARYVTGVAFKDDDSVHLRLAGNVLHRWIEIRYDDVGWVFCDPAGKVNHVEATYLVLGVQDLHPLPELLQRAVDTRIELIKFEDGFRTIGALPSLDRRLRIRPNRLFVNP